jgi:predicted dehydrogenase
MVARTPLRIAVIGCGNVSRGHIRGWLGEPERARIVALVDVEPRFADEHRERFGLRDASIHTDYEHVLARDDVDVVDLCTPSHLHAPQIMAALEAGKHVLTEKPVGYNLEECRRLRWYAHRYPHLRVGVGYSLRYYPLNIRVRQLLREGAIGRILSIEAAHNHPHDCRGAFDEDTDPGLAGGRALSDRSGRYVPGSELSHATHVFDFMRYLGGEVRDVFAFRERAGIFALMRFESGAAGKATAGIAPDQGLATPHVLCVQGTEGTLFTQNRRTTDAWGSGGYHGYIVTGGQQKPIEVEATDTGHGDATRTRNFLDAVLHGTPLIAPLEDAIRTSELLHAIWDSYNLEIRVPVHRAHKTG